MPPRGTQLTNAQASRMRSRRQGNRARIEAKQGVNLFVPFKETKPPDRPGSRDCRVLVQGGQITELGKRLGYRPKHLKTNIPFPTDKEIAAAKVRQRTGSFN